MAKSAIQVRGENWESLPNTRCSVTLPRGIGTHWNAAKVAGNPMFIVGGTSQQKRSKQPQGRERHKPRRMLISKVICAGAKQLMKIDNVAAVRNAYAVAERKGLEGWINVFTPDGVHRQFGGCDLPWSIGWRLSRGSLAALNSSLSPGFSL